MFAASTYDEIVRQEREIDSREIVVFLFVRPTKASDREIINEFEYIHYNSGKYCSVYAIGYTNDPDKATNPEYRPVTEVSENKWWFSTKAFVEFKTKLEQQIKWRYSGESEILILQNNPGKSKVLYFSNYVSININSGLRKGYLDSFQVFMESLIRSARGEVTAKEAIRGVRKGKLSIKDAVLSAIEDSKKVPKPIKSILTDRLFYRSANTFL